MMINGFHQGHLIITRKLVSCGSFSYILGFPINSPGILLNQSSGTWKSSLLPPFVVSPKSSNIAVYDFYIIFFYNIGRGEGNGRRKAMVSCTWFCEFTSLPRAGHSFNQKKKKRALLVFLERNNQNILETSTNAFALNVVISSAAIHP